MNSISQKIQKMLLLSDLGEQEVIMKIDSDYFSAVDSEKQHKQCWKSEEYRIL